MKSKILSLLLLSFIFTGLVFANGNKNKKTLIETDPTTLYLNSTITTGSVNLNPTEAARELYLQTNLSLSPYSVYEDCGSYQYRGDTVVWVPNIVQVTKYPSCSITL